MFAHGAMMTTRRRKFIACVALASAILGVTGCVGAPSTPNSVETPNSAETPSTSSPTSSAGPSETGEASTDPTAKACTSFNESFVTYAQLVEASGTKDQFEELGLALTKSTSEAQNAGVDVNVVGSLSALNVLALSRSIGDATVESADEDNLVQAVLHSSSACDSAGVTISMG